MCVCVCIIYFILNVCCMLYVFQLGWTPVMIASANRRVDTTRFLVDHTDADITIVSSKGINPLMMAVRQRRNNVEIINILLSKGIDGYIFMTDHVCYTHTHTLSFSNYGW